MDKRKIEELLHLVASGSLSPSEATDKLKDLPYINLGFANLDSHRSVRQGLPEVVFCPGKSPEQIVEIMRSLFTQNDIVLASESFRGSRAVRYSGAARCAILRCL